MNNPDLWVQALQELGLVKGLNSAGMLDITCPFVEEHTGQVDNGSAYLGNERFKCHHRCDCRDSLDFHARVKELLADQMTGDPFAVASTGEGWLAHQRFKCEAIDKDRVADLVASVSVALEQTDKEAIAKMRDDYVYVLGFNAFVHLDTGIKLGRSEFQARNCHVIPAGTRGAGSSDNVFLNTGGRQVVTATYRPGQPIICDMINELGKTVNAVNLWRAPDFKPIPAVDADIKIWLDHVARIVPDQAERSAFLDKLAFILQHPGNKVNYATVLGGLPGIGKDTVLEPLFRAIGKTNVSQIQASMLECQFNGWLNSQIVCVTEMSQGAGRYDLYNHMKTYLAKPPETLMINEKNQKPYRVPNEQCWFMFTNRPDAIALEEGDRRHSIHWSDADVPPASYFQALWGWYEKSGAEKVAGWLLARDVSTFNPAAVPIWTRGAQNMMLDSMSPVSRWVLEEIKGGYFAGRTLVAVREFVEVAAARGAAVPGKVSTNINPKSVAQALRVAGARPLGDVRLPDKRKVALWALERPELYSQMKEGQLGAAYERECLGASPFSAAS